MRPSVILVLVVSAAAVGAVVFKSRSVPNTGVATKTLAEPTSEEKSNATRPNEVLTSRSTTVDDIPETAVPKSAARCDLSSMSIEDEPAFVAERERLLPLVPTQTSLAAYRGQNISDLETLAETGDARAMYVLGLAELNLLKKQIAEDPVDLVESIRLFEIDFASLNAADTDHLDRGSHWLYEAALRGNLLALDELERIELYRYGGVIQRGLVVGDPDWDDNTRKARDAELSYYIAEEIRSRSHPEMQGGLPGFLNQLNAEASRYSQWVEAITASAEVEAIIENRLALYETDRRRAGIELPRLPEPMPLEDFFQSVCGDAELPKEVREYIDRQQ